MMAAFRVTPTEGQDTPNMGRVMRDSFRLAARCKAFRPAESMTMCSKSPGLLRPGTPLLMALRETDLLGPA